MNGSRPWCVPDELLELYEINRLAKGARDWSALCWLYSLGVRFPDLYNEADIERGLMREARLSPEVFWGRIKRELAPILEADPLALEALGLDPEARTGRKLALCVGALMAADPEIQMDLDDAREVARSIRASRMGAL